MHEESPQPVEPVPPQPCCPQCGEPFSQVGWITNEQAGVITFYHDEPGCMAVVGCQLVAVERRIQPAGGSLLSH